MICRFCGMDVDADDLLHALQCDGRQGAVEEAIEAITLQARTSDPETSREAMAAYDEDRMRSAMAMAIALHQERGPMADYEYKRAFGEAWQQPCDQSLYRQARNQARNNGFIRDSGERRRNPQTNQRQVVWEACHEAPPDVARCPTCGGVLRRRKGH